MTDTSPTLRTSRLQCGLELVTERHPSQRSANICWLVPGGTACDPLDRGDGWGVLLSEFLLRGAGTLDSRGWSDAMDRLGANRSITADTYHQRLGATVPGDRLVATLGLLVDVVRRPAFPEAALDGVRGLCLQELAGLEDDPAHLTHIRLDEIRFPSPFDRHGLGVETHLAAVTRDDLAGHWESMARPEGSILAVAGAVDHDEIARSLDAALNGWSGSSPRPIAQGSAIGGIRRIERDSAQVHLAIGFDGPVASDPDALAFRTAIGVLGGGTSSRLFLDVRERRGLAYSVGSRFEEGLAFGAVTISAGTTPERIAETLERIDVVLEGYDEGPTDEEVRRVAVGLRAGGLMQQEQGPVRARQLALDTFRRGRPRSVEEILGSYDAIDADDVRRVVRERMGPAWRAAATRCVLGPAAAVAGVG
jgi:predicted Zn-dependent peptidase